MDWNKLLNQHRLGTNTPEDDITERSPFERDADRVIFSSAFRRLGRKTQVHPLAANDHVHTRLTHSIEVSRVGKALGKELGNRLLQSPEKYKHKLPHEVSPDDMGSIVQ